MVDNSKCWLKDNCSHIDCDKFCMRHYKLDYLYNQALISDVQRKHITFKIENGAIGEEDLEAFKSLQKIENNILDFVANGDSLYIHSKICGNGKTSWALRLVQTYFNKIWPYCNLECKALYINVPRFLLALKDNITTKSDYVEHIKENVLDCDLVVWDEIGTKGLTQFEHENILSLINARIDLGKANIYTSNLTDEELHTAIGDRLYSRIVNLSDTYVFNGADRRGTIV